MPNRTDLVWQLEPNRQSLPGPFVEFRRGQTQRRPTNRRRLRMEPPRRHPRFQSHASHPAPTPATGFLIGRARRFSNPSRTLIGRGATRPETWGHHWRSFSGRVNAAGAAQNLALNDTSWPYSWFPSARSSAAGCDRVTVTNPDVKSNPVMSVRAWRFYNISIPQRESYPLTMPKQLTVVFLT